MDLVESDRISQRWELKEIPDSPSVDFPGDPDHWSLFISIHRWESVTLLSLDGSVEILNYDMVEISPAEKLRFTMPVSALLYRTSKKIWQSKLFQCLASLGVPVTKHREFVDKIFNMANNRPSIRGSMVKVELEFIRTEVRLDNLAFEIEAVYNIMQDNLIDDDRAVNRGASAGAISKLIGSARQVLPVDTDDCPICLDGMTGRDGERIELPSCKHAFHCSCIVPWLEKNETCPICRRQLVYDSDN